MAKIQGELLRGNIDTIILKCLFEGDKYGNEICKAVEERTLGQFEIKQPTLYSCLTRLENQGLVTCTWVNTNNGGRRKYFAMTPAGYEFFTQKQKDWEFSRTVVDKLISEQIFDLSAGEQPLKSYGEKAESDSEILATTVVAERDEKEEPEIVASTVVAETEEQLPTPPLENRFARGTGAEQEIVATAAVSGRPAAVFTEESAEPKVTYANREADNTVPLTQPTADRSGISYYSQLADQTYTPPKRPLSDYFRFEEIEEPEEEPEDNESLAAEVITRAETVERQAAATSMPPASTESTVSSEILKRSEPIRTEPLSPEESKKRDDARNVLYAEAGDAFDNLNSVSEQQNETNRKPKPAIPADERENAISADYRSTLSSLFPSSVTHEFAGEAKSLLSDSEPGEKPKERLANGLVIRRHSRELTREYNEKYYIFGNRLRLYQNLILAAVILVEILACYFGLYVAAGIKGDFWLYFVAAAIAVAFPLVSAAVYFVNPYKIIRNDVNKKNYLTFRWILALQAIVLIVCVEILVDKNVLTELSYLNRIVLPAALCVDIALHAMIGQLLVKSKRFAVN